METNLFGYIIWHSTITGHKTKTTRHLLYTTNFVVSSLNNACPQPESVLTHLSTTTSHPSSLQSSTCTYLLPQPPTLHDNHPPPSINYPLQPLSTTNTHSCIVTHPPTTVTHPPSMSTTLHNSQPPSTKVIYISLNIPKFVLAIFRAGSIFFFFFFERNRTPSGKKMVTGVLMITAS